MHSSCEIYFPSELHVNIHCNTARFLNLIVMIQCQLVTSTRVPFLIPIWSHERTKIQVLLTWLALQQSINLPSYRLQVPYASVAVWRQNVSNKYSKHSLLKAAQLYPILLNIISHFCYRYGIFYEWTWHVQACTGGTVSEQAGVSNAFTRVEYIY